ncbi:hypothetical protein [Microbacterium sp. Ld4]|uniref:hypothetical protein n=1 Tax=Microbacterium sp. Ld4 TaxID=649157 RepID=UPI0038667D8F
MMHRHLAAGLLLGAALLLTSCATPAAPGSAPDAPVGSALGSLWPGPPSGEVVAQGMVLDTGDSPELCLGAVAESAPTQCSGIPLEGWTWEGVDGAETMSGQTWGSYAVQGTYDGETFTVTQPPVLLALYDPMKPADPTGGKTGSGTAEELQTISDTLPDALAESYLGSYTDDRGWLWVDVVWDDGTFQDAADADFGDGKVVVNSALRAVG